MSLRLTDLTKRLLSRPARKPLTARLRCETLEDRTVPAVVYTGTFDWGGLATVAVTVTDDTPGEYLWAYHVANTGFASVAKFPPGAGQGIGTFVVYSLAAGNADDLTGPAGWAGDAGVFMNDPTLIHWTHPEATPADILIGQSGDFSFTTPVVPVVTWAGEAYDSTYSSGVSGQLAVPGAPPPEVSVAALADATEGGANGAFEFTRTGDTSSSLTVQFTLSGTASPGADYVAAGTVTFAPGSGTADWEVGAIDDGEWEEAESVVLTLDDASPLATPDEIGPLSTATFLIQNNPVDFDLDVNADGDLNDPVDRAANYLPGYEGDTQKVSVGGSFNADTYTGQRMKLILNGIGWASVMRVEFVIVPSLNHPGYASNRSNPGIEGAGFDKDYSFSGGYDLNSVTVNPLIGEFQEAWGPTGGEMEANKTWVNFYAKDYGGAARVEARVWVGDGQGGEQAGPVYSLKVPKDDDNDGLADKWELQMGARWNAQYGVSLTPAEMLAGFIPDQDKEGADPDHNGLGRERLVPQKEEGDAHTVLEEYRGYILDGGGLDGAGANGHAGGHIRLDPARKEILVEVDRAATLHNLPATLPDIMDGASKVFSNADRGTGIYMYYLIDDAALNLPEDAVDTTTKIRQKLAAHHNPNLQDDFLHVLLIDKGVKKALTPPNGPPSRVPTFSVGRSANHPVGSAPLVERGVVFATTDATDFYNATAFPLTAEAYSCALAHEITHLLIHKRNADGFDAAEHTTNPDPSDPPGGPLDAPCLMFVSTRANREFSTVRFFPVVQVQLSTATGEWRVF